MDTPAACHSLWAASTPQPPTRQFLPSTASTVAVLFRPLNPFCLLCSFPLPPAALALWPLHRRHQCTSANAMAPTLLRSRATSMPLEKSAAASLCIESATATICCTFGPPPRSGSLQALQTSEKKQVSAPRICACSRAHVTVLFVLRSWLGRPGEFSAHQRGAFPKRVAGGCRPEADHVCRGLCVRLVTFPRCVRRPCKMK